jgi:two-component system invasion response regulator UvrY
VEQALRPRVLIVDDDADIRRALHHLLDDYGVAVVGEAADGWEGVQLASALLPDVVLMDLRMPVLGGIEATARLTQAAPAVRVVVCTAYSDKSVSQLAVQAGAVAVVAKGEHPRALLATIHRAWTQVLADRAWQVVPS